MLELADFKEFTLNKTDIILAFGLFSIILITIGIFAKLTFAKDRKKMSWIISLCNSFVLSFAGIIYLSIKLPSYYKNFFLFGTDYVRDNVYQSIDNVSFLINLWFALANIFDLTFGLMFYIEYLDPLTAFVHHTLYIWLMLLCSTGNGIFISTKIFSSGFVLVAIEEIPTFLLALGSVFPSCRTDIGFGITFFILRLVYHAFILIYSIIIGTDQPIHVLLSLTGTLHIYWFSTWALKYGNKMLKKKSTFNKSKMN